MVLADSTRLLSTSRTPAIVFTINGKKAAQEIKNIAATFYNKAKSLDEKTFQEIRVNPKSPILVSEFDDAIKKPKTIIIYYFKYQGVRLFLRRLVSIITTNYLKLEK